MPAIPAICDNPACGAIFASPIHIGNSRNIFLNNIVVRPCPRCGGNGHVADGRYDAIAGNIYANLSNVKDIRTLKRLIRTIESAIKDRDFKTAKDKLLRKSPNWRNVWNFLPEENAGNAVAIYTLILFFLQTVAILYSMAKPPTSETYINQTFEYFYESQPRIYLEEPQQESRPFRMNPLSEAIKRSL